MKGDNRIAEMIREMEQTFAERDALYKERDEALARSHPGCVQAVAGGEVGV